MSEPTSPPTGTPAATPTDEGVAGKKHTAGALDIRNIIGGLIGVYGLILTFMGIFGDQETDKTGGVNANLWAGLVMIVVGVMFLSWARLKPIVVPAVHEDDEASHGEPHAG